MDETFLGLAGVKSIANSSKMRHLTRLFLSSNELNIDAFEVLANSVYMSSLEVLYIENDITKDEILRVLQKPHRLHNLMEIDVLDDYF